MRKLGIVSLLALVVLISGCGGGDDDKAPTPSETPRPLPTLPPEWTATPPGFVPSETPTPAPSSTRTPGADGTSGEAGLTSDEAGGAPTPGGEDDEAWFQATWTPVPTNTFVPTFTPTITLTPSFTPTSLPDICFELAPVDTVGVTWAGYAVPIRWNYISDLGSFSRYLIQLFKGDQEVWNFIIADPLSYVVPGTTEIQYEIPGHIFEENPRDQVYSWVVWPLDINGERVCYSINNEIIVKTGPRPSVTPFGAATPAGGAVG